MLKKIATCAAALALAAVAMPARADEPVALRFAIPGSGPQSPTWSMLWQPWIAQVEKDADGTLKLQTFFGATLANLFNVYDRVANGVAEMGTGVQGSVGGRFPGSSVVELPSDIVGREGAAGFWKIFQNGMIASEYGDTKLLSLFIYPQSFLNVQKPIQRLDDVKGLKLATLTRADAEVATRLGAAPVTTSPIEVYEILQRRGADGIIIGWLGLVGFKLAEVTSHHVIVGLGSGGAFLTMNKGAYDKLPAKAQTAINRNAGAVGSKAAGAAMDRIYAASQNVVRGLPNHTIGPLAPAEFERYQKEIVTPLIDEWTKRITNGPAILAAYRAEVAQVRREK